MYIRLENKVVFWFKGGDISDWIVDEEIDLIGEIVMPRP
jgi:hypothetical protein